MIIRYLDPWGKALQEVGQAKTMPSRYELMTLQREKSELTEQSLVPNLNPKPQASSCSGFGVQDLALETL